MRSVLQEIELQRKLVGKKKIRYSFAFSQYYHQWYNAMLLAQLAPHPEYTVLDCGCGTGILLPSLEKCYNRIIGLDLSADNLREARTDARRARLLVGDIGELPLAPRSFDHIVCRVALHHLPDLGLAFRGLFDVLKEGGDLVISEPINDSLFLRLLRVTTGHCTANTCTSEEWIQMAEAAGFRTVGWFNVGYLALPLLGYPEHSYVMRYVPFRMPLARLLLRLDRFFADIPWINARSWHAIFHFKKPFTLDVPEIPRRDHR